MKIVISNRSAVPIYEQIKNLIKEAILSGEISEDEMLPSIRQLAKDLKISVITTTRAYKDLEEEGFVISIQGKGSFVLPRNNEWVRETVLRQIEESFEQALSIAEINNWTLAELQEILNQLYEERKNEKRD